LASFIEENTWQELCRQWLLTASAQNELPLPIEHVVAEWKRTFAIDVVGISEMDRSLVLGCCLWNEAAADAEPLHELLRRTSSIIPTGEEDWSVYYVGFAAGGWLPGVQEEIEAALHDEKASRARRKWQPTGVRLVNLGGLDADLTRWTEERA
jgi:hypothetical protein